MVGVAQLAERRTVPPHFDSHGSLAQLVEQGTLNPKVEGSTPSRSTIRHSGRGSGPGFFVCHPARQVEGLVRTTEYGSLAQLVEQGTLNPKVEGSTPSRSTI